MKYICYFSAISIYPPKTRHCHTSQGLPNACCLQATRRQYDRDRDSATAGSEVNGYQRRKDRVPFDATEMMKKIQESFGAGSIGRFELLWALQSKEVLFFSPLCETLQTSSPAHFNAEGTTSHLVKRSMLRPGDFTQANSSRTAANMAAGWFSLWSGLLQIGEILLWWCQVPFEENFFSELLGGPHLTFGISVQSLQHVGRFT